MMNHPFKILRKHHLMYTSSFQNYPYANDLIFRFHKWVTLIGFGFDPSGFGLEQVQVRKRVKLNGL